ncbi:hypothetical protein N2152v2_010312 [Parachlorella kessleri]
MEKRKVGLADLPPVALRKIWTDEAGDSPSGLQECFAAEASCKALRAALRGPILGSLRVGGACEGKQAWALQTHPSASRLQIYGSAASPEGQAFLNALQPQAVTEIECCRVPGCLPDPAAFTNLIKLKVNCVDCNPAWLASLSLLPKLATMELNLTAAPACSSRTSSSSFVHRLPMMRNLRSCKLFIESGAAVCICLALLPALEKLDMWGSIQMHWDPNIDRGTAEVVGDARNSPKDGALQLPCRLRKLDLALSVATLDFEAMPTLDTATLWAEELHDAASIASASCLSELHLGTELYEYTRLDQYWVAAMLTAAASLPALRVLTLLGTYWDQDVADALVSMSNVKILALAEPEDNFFDDEEAARPVMGPGPLWDGLRALHWAIPDPLPQAIRAAAQLVMLGYNSHPTPEEVAAIRSLPLLRSAKFPPPRGGQPPCWTREELEGGMPGTASLQVGFSNFLCRQTESFVSQAKVAGLLE